MDEDAEVGVDDRQGNERNGPRHIAEALAELLLQLPESDTEAARRPVAATWSS